MFHLNSNKPPDTLTQLFKKNKKSHSKNANYDVIDLTKEHHSNNNNNIKSDSNNNNNIKSDSNNNNNIKSDSNNNKNIKVIQTIIRIVSH